MTVSISLSERVELRHVRTFLALSEELHFGRAARRLHVAQSAVSQTIRALEDEVGAPLFVRGPGGARLTAAGEHLVESARRAMTELDRGAATARRAASGEVGRLTLRFGPLSALTALPSVVARFRRELPGVDVRIEPGRASDSMAAIAEGRADIAFVSTPKHDPGALAFRTVESSPIVALLPAHHRLARRRGIRFGDLSGEVMLLPEHLDDDASRAAFERRCREERFEPASVIALGQLEALLAFVAAGAGISFAPAIVARAAFPGVVLVPVRPAIRAGIAAVWSEARLPATGRRFLAMLGEARS